MGFVNWEGEREATQHSANEYKKKIIKLMELRGYFLDKDSSIDGILSDLVMQRPNNDGEKRTVVESKYTDLSLADKDFLKEMAKYFIAYMRNRFYLKIIARYLTNTPKWKAIFDETKLIDLEIESFWKKILEVLDDSEKKVFEKYNFDDFEQFITDCEVTRVEYPRLLQLIEDEKESKKFDRSADYLKEEENLVFTPETLTSNIYPVKGYPTYVFTANIKKSRNFNNIWKEKASRYIFPFKEQAYSFKPFPTNIIDNFLIKSSVNKVKFDELKLSPEDLLNLKQRLVRSFIISKAANIGYKYHKKKSKNILFFHHPKISEKEYKIKAQGSSRKRWVTKVYAKDGDVKFVRHRGLLFRVTIFNGEVCIIFSNITLFSDKGKMLKTGEDAWKLHTKFPPTMAYNDSELSLLNFLVDLIDLPTMDFSHPNFVVIGKSITLDSPCKSERGEIFEDSEIINNPFSEYEDANEI